MTATPPTRKRPASATTSSPTTRRSRPGSRRYLPDAARRAERAAAAGHAAGAVPAHPVLPEALQVLLLPRLHRQERHATSRSTSTPSSRKSSCYSQTAVRRRPAARLRLLRRRHAVVPERRAARRPDDAAAARSCRGTQAARSHLRVRAGHAAAAQARNARASMGVTRLSLGVENFKPEILQYNGRAHLEEEIYRAYGWARDLGFHADQHRPDRRHGRRGLGQLAGLRRARRSRWPRTASPSTRWSCRTTRSSPRS